MMKKLVLLLYIIVFYHISITNTHMSLANDYPKFDFPGWLDDDDDDALFFFKKQ